MSRIFTPAKAICYSGYRDNQSPFTVCPSIDEIEEDLRILVSEGYKYIRMYDPNDHARRALEVIKKNKLPLKCLIGVDSLPEIDNPESATGPIFLTDEERAFNIKRNDSEYDRLIDLVKNYGDYIIAVSVGNENTPSWGTRLVSEERLIEHVLYLKKHISKPVTFCEGAGEWPALTKLSQYLDFLSVHSYPMHGRIPVENAVAANKEQYELVKNSFPDKEIIFTEVGWSVRESSHMIPGQGSVENQKRYITELYEWLNEADIMAFVFEAFDETWKASSPDKGECNWGLHYMDRTRKW